MFQQISNRCYSPTQKLKDPLHKKLLLDHLSKQRVINLISKIKSLINVLLLSKEAKI